MGKNDLLKNCRLKLRKIRFLKSLWQILNTFIVETRLYDDCITTIQRFYSILTKYLNNLE